MKMFRHLALSTVVLFLVSVPSTPVHAQTKAPIDFSWMPNQITASWMYTREDYEFSSAPGMPSQRLTLNGGNVEYAYHRWYPWMLDSSFRYQAANLLGQHLITGALGGGYVRQFGRTSPYGELQVGITHTSSSDYQYLFKGGSTGITTLVQAGVDINFWNSLFGVRPVYVENQYLPYGVSQSVYWNIGSGIYIRFEHQR